MTAVIGSEAVEDSRRITDLLTELRNNLTPAACKYIHVHDRTRTIQLSWTTCEMLLI